MNTNACIQFLQVRIGASSGLFFEPSYGPGIWIILSYKWRQLIFLLPFFLESALRIAVNSLATFVHHYSIDLLITIQIITKFVH